MSQDKTPSNNSSADDSANDVEYVFYRGVRTPVRNPLLQTAPANAPATPQSHTAQTVAPPKPATQAPVPNSLACTDKTLITKKVPVFKPWLNDSIILPHDSAAAKKSPPGNQVSTRMAASAADQRSSQVSPPNLAVAANSSAKNPLNDDALLPAISSSAPLCAENAAATNANVETNSNQVNAETKMEIADTGDAVQRLRLPLGQLRPAIQLPSLFAPGEVVEEDKQATTLAALAANRAPQWIQSLTEPLLSPPRKSEVLSAADKAITPVSNETLLREIEQLHAHIREMNIALQELQTRSSHGRSESETQS